MNKPALVLILLALFSAVVYVLFAAARGVVGFPLDDAWIHQVYARNLAMTAEFAFTPGRPSAGSTSPLWTILLAGGYLLHIDYGFWSYLFGAMLLGASALISMRLASRIFPQSNLSPFLLPLFVLFEWHMAWAAVSGMEIPLFVFLSLLLLDVFLSGQHKWALGMIASLLTLTRPEGFALAGLVGLALLLPQPGDEHGESRWARPSELARALSPYALGYALLIIPYLLFNLAVSGTLLPNTYYAKNVEYGILFQRIPLVSLWLQVAFAPWVGPQALLLPGLLWAGISLVRNREWRSLVPFAWLLLLPVLYAIRLPVAYQHGRYEMPIIPFIGLYGIYGTEILLRRLRVRVLRTTWALSTAVLVAAFWLIGANQYAEDVAIIDCEMVRTAQWVAANAPADAMVAAHDIGALGYFYPRPIIDLAGLVSPEVVPFMRDEGRLHDFLISRQATLVVFFPDWYPILASDTHLTPLYQRNCPVSRSAGGTDMVVYGFSLTQR